MHNPLRCFSAVLVLLAIASSGHAHFLFVRVLPAAEAGRFAEVYFSDQADAGDPRFIDKITGTKLWLQQTPGKFKPLNVSATPDRLRAAVPPSGSVGVIGECTYGVLTRGKLSFLLRHYPKAVAGRGDDVFALQAKQEIPFEIQLGQEGNGSLTFIALRDGKPVPNATFWSVASDLKGGKFTANADGKATWKPSKAGQYAVYTGETLKKAGVHQGDKYDEIREFTTIAFTWPLEVKGADAKAVQLFQDAMEARAAWTKFPGFTAEVNANADGRAWKGTATITAKGKVELKDEDEVVTPWVREQLESMVLHRLGGPRKEPSLRFADQIDDHPLGRLLVFEGGKFASSYRIKDRQIMVVNRSLGKLNMTITVIDNDVNAEKKFLPRSYTVQYWHASTGELDRSETIQNRWTRRGDVDLPTLLSVQTSSAAGLSVKTMTLGGHRILTK